jgi:hypothetical protein
VNLQRRLPTDPAPANPSASSNPGRGPLSPNTRPARASDDPGLVDAVQRIILMVAENKGTVTADDVREVAPNIPFKRSVLGAAFLHLQQAGHIIEAGYEPSRVPSNHGRRIKVYRHHRIRACDAPEQQPEVAS